MKRAHGDFSLRSVTLRGNSGVEAAARHPEAYAKDLVADAEIPPYGQNDGDEALHYSAVRLRFIYDSPAFAEASSFTGRLANFPKVGV